MTFRDKFIGAFLLILVALVIAIWLLPAGSDYAPSLQLKTTDGRQISIGAQQKGPVLVNFWATTCRTCMKEIPLLARLYQQLQPQGLEIVGVSVFYDPPIQVMEMVRHKQIPYPIVFDLDKRIQLGFGMKTPVTPATFLFDQHGKIVYKTLGMPDMVRLEKLIRTLLKQTNTPKEG